MVPGAWIKDGEERDCLLYTSYWEIPGLVERYNSAYQKQLDQFYYNPGSSTGLTKDQLLSVAETLRQEAETLADTAEDEKDSITKQEYEEYRNNEMCIRDRASL